MVSSLSLGGGKEAVVRLAVTIAAVGLGVGLLLGALAGMNAIHAQNARTAWLNTGNSLGPAPGEPPTSGAESHNSPLWWLYSTDYFGNKSIDRVDLAVTGANSPVPPGVSHLPGPGQFYASPALSRLLRTTPAAELRDRYPGAQIGLIGSSALPSPSSLIIVVGHTAAQLSRVPGAVEVTSIATTTGDSRGANGWDSNKVQIILAVGVLALLFPVLVFIATATRLSAARREQRFAAIRLVGATPRQVSVISTVEASVAAIGGVVVGFGAFFLLRPLLTDIPFTGQPFAPGDLSLSGVDILLVVIGVPIAAIAVARIAMRRVQISPLGVSRRVTPPAPRPYGLILLLAGTAELAYFVAVGPPRGSGAQTLAYFSGCLLILAGLLISGPWLTMLGSRLVAGRTSRPAVLIAGRRLSDDPRAGFRAVGGLIIAIFVTSVSVGVITTVSDYHSLSSGTSASATLFDQFPALPIPGQELSPQAVTDSELTQLKSIPGIRGATVLYAPSEGTQGQVDLDQVLALCNQITHTPAIGRCPAQAQVVTLTGNLDNTTVTKKSNLAGRIWPAADISPAQLRAFPTRALVVETNGSIAATERARTALEVAFPEAGPPATLSEISATTTRTITELRQLTNIVILVSLVVAGCSLAVSVTAGVVDRKRPFSLLRLTGVPLTALRRVVAIEAGIPLLAIAVIAATLGFLSAALFLKSQLGETLRPPTLEYYVLLAAGLLASLAIIASTLPLIERITGPEVARNE